MELTDQRTLAALFGASPVRRGNYGARGTRKNFEWSSVYEPPALKLSLRRCKCGICARCRDDQRWERIFQEKFADPDYYTRPILRHDSPLNTL